MTGCGIEPIGKRKANQQARLQDLVITRTTYEQAVLLRVLAFI